MVRAHFEGGHDEALGRANERCGACRTCLGRSHPPRPLADCDAGGGSLCDVAAKLDGLAREDRRHLARLAAVPAALGLLWRRDPRFSSFLASPQAAVQHLKYALLREPDRQVGHNPAGGWMALFLLALLLAETLSGLYVANDIADVGPLTAMIPAGVADAIEASHAIVWEVLLPAILLHVLAIFGYAAVKGQNLLLPMITGTKVLPESVPAPRIASPTRAAVLFAGSAAAAVILANLM